MLLWTRVPRYLFEPPFCSLDFMFLSICVLIYSAGFGAHPRTPASVPPWAVSQGSGAPFWICTQKWACWITWQFFFGFLSGQNSYFVCCSQACRCGAGCLMVSPRAFSTVTLTLSSQRPGLGGWCTLAEGRMLSQSDHMSTDNQSEYKVWGWIPALQNQQPNPFPLK